MWRHEPKSHRHRKSEGSASTGAVPAGDVALGLRSWRNPLSITSKVFAELRPKSRRVVAIYSAFQVFFGLLVWVPVFYEFQKQIGLSDTSIFHIQSLYYLVFCLLEVPTGWFADRHGYKKSLLAGALILVLANLLPIAAANEAGMLWHFLGIALARSLISGASSAYLYEWLKQQGEATYYKTIEGEARFWSLVARVLSWAVAGHLLAFNLFAPYALSAMSAGLAVMAALLLPHVEGVSGAKAEDKAAGASDEKLRLLWQSLQTSPTLILLMWQGVSVFVMVRILQVNLFQPLLKHQGFSVESLGWVMAVMTVFEAVGSKATAWFRERMSDSAAVTALSLAISIAVAALAWSSGMALSMVLMCLFSLAAGVVFPVQKQLMNDAIADGRIRATLLSTESILDRAVCALVVWPLGGLLAIGALPEVLVISGGVSMLLTLGVHVSLQRRVHSAGSASPAPAPAPATEA